VKAMERIVELERQLAGSSLRDFTATRKIGGRESAALSLAGDVTMLHGACSVVYEARSLRPEAADVPLALKVMINSLGDQTSDLYEQFSAEYELLADAARLPRHQNIIPVFHRFVDQASGSQLPGFDFSPQDINPRTTFIVLPLYDRDLKGDMRHVFRAGRRFTEERARRLAQQLLGAIAHLKEYRIVHRDIKADNVMLNGEGEGENMVLIDFGQCLDCAKYQLDGFKMPLPINMPRGGAPNYLAPEVVGTFVPRQSLSLCLCPASACLLPPSLPPLCTPLDAAPPVSVSGQAKARPRDHD
jgi:serine/threonine protein kinase